MYLTLGAPISTVIEPLVRAMLGSLFIFAGGEKLGLDPSFMQHTVLGRYIGQPIHAALLGCAEMILGAWIVLATHPWWAFAVAWWVLTTFSFILWRHVWADGNVACGCLGGAAPTDPLGRDLVWSAWRTTALAVGSGLWCLAGALRPHAGLSFQSRPPRVSETLHGSPS